MNYMNTPLNTKQIMAAFPLLLLLMGVAFEYTGFDVWWVSHFYDEQSRSWPFRGHWFFDTVIHGWGRYFDILAAILWLMFFCFTWCLGLLFGIGQQVRGAHFPSHDLFTMVICWYSALIVYCLFYSNTWKSHPIW